MGAMPVTAGVVSPLVLAGVLLLSGLAKLAQPDATRSALVALRLPRALWAGWVAVALPVVELVVAAGLVTPWLPSSRYAAGAAFALCLAYLVVIARALTFSPRPHCACFGRIGPARVNGWMLARNVVLVVLAGLALASAVSGQTVPSELGVLSGGDAAGWVALAVGLTLALVLRRGADEDSAEANREGGAHTGRGAGAVLLSAEGAPRELGELAAERPQLLVLVDCYCGPTYRAARELATWQADLPGVDVRLVFAGIEPLTPAEGGASPAATWHDPESALWAELGLATSPSAVLVGTAGHLVAGPACGWEPVVTFVRALTEGRDHAGH